MQRIRKTAKKSPGNQLAKNQKKKSGETNNRLTVQTWRSSERDGTIDGDLTYKGRCKVKNSLTKHNIHSVIEEVD